MPDEMIKITGLWENETKDGKKYYSGYMGEAKILVFENGFKTEDKHPAFNLYVAKKPKKDESDNGSSEQEPQVQSDELAPTPDDVPF